MFYNAEPKHCFLARDWVRSLRMRFVRPGLFPPHGVAGTVILPSFEVTVAPADWIRKQAFTAFFVAQPS